MPLIKKKFNDRLKSFIIQISIIKKTHHALWGLRMIAIINRYLSINHYQPLHTGLSETSELGGLESLTRLYTISMSWSYQRMVKEGWIEDPD